MQANLSCGTHISNGKLFGWVDFAPAPPKLGGLFLLSLCNSATSIIENLQIDSAIDEQIFFNVFYVLLNVCLILKNSDFIKIIFKKLIFKIVLIKNTISNECSDEKHFILLSKPESNRKQILFNPK
jgi:hypothetical protein